MRPIYIDVYDNGRWGVAVTCYTSADATACARSYTRTYRRVRIRHPWGSRRYRISGEWRDGQKPLCPDCP